MRVLAGIAALLLIASSASAQVTDLASRPLPPLPVLPAAGGTFTDPTFGTTILRVTDEHSSAGGSCGTAYSYWPTFNKNSTRLWSLCDHYVAMLQDFDASTLTLSNPRRILGTPTPGGMYPTLEDATWSQVDPDVIFAHDEKALWSWNVVTQSWNLVKDFSALATNLSLWQMSVSGDDNVFAFTKRKNSSGILGYVAWVRSSDTMPVNVDTSQLDEVQVDKTGRYLLVKTGLQGADGVIQNRVFDLSTGLVEDLTDGTPDFGPGHSDNGRDLVIGYDNWNNRITGRALSSPHAPYTVFSWDDDWNQDQHVSMRGDDERWVTLTSHGSSAAWGPLHEEVYQVATDGSQRVRRLAHHRAVGTGYWATPRGNISRDGRFIAFTSDWGGSPRRDLFVVVAPATGVCGDDVLDIGERCDDGNLVDGDGCDSNCTATACGNGIRTGAEDCDDGNTAGGDCCSATCAFEDSTSACSDDNPCTQGDHCDGAGTCAGSAEPLTGCHEPRTARIRLTAGSRGRFLWSWARGQATMEDFGDPVAGTTNYTLCLYDQQGATSVLRLRMEMPAGGTCGGKPCWAVDHGVGLSYRDAAATPDGITKASFRAGESGSAAIQLKARGMALPSSALPFSQQTTVTAQLQADRGACWTTAFSAPASNNDAGKFGDRF